MERELRRNQDALINIGSGIIAFGVWSVIKAVLYFFLNRSEMEDIVEQAMSDVEFSPDDYEIYRLLVRIIVYFFVGIILLADMGIRLYLGLSARTEGMEGKKGYAYVVVGGLMVLLSIAIVVFEGKSLIDGTVAESARGPSEFVGLLIDFTSIVVMLEMILSAIRVKRYTRLLEGAG